MMRSGSGIWNRLDRAAVLLSGMCVVHCVATVFLLGALSSLGHLFSDPRIHEAGLAVATVLGAVALGAGMARHGSKRPLLFGLPGLALMASALFVQHGIGEALLTIAGVSLVALAHMLNARTRPAHA